MRNVVVLRVPPEYSPRLFYVLVVGRVFLICC